MNEAVLDAAMDEADVASNYRDFGLTVPKLQKLRSRGEGPRYRKVGRVITYDRVDIEVWLEDCKIEPGNKDTD